MTIVKKEAVRQNVNREKYQNQYFMGYFLGHGEKQKYCIKLQVTGKLSALYPQPDILYKRRREKLEPLEAVTSFVDGILRTEVLSSEIQIDVGCTDIFVISFCWGNVLRIICSILT